MMFPEKSSISRSKEGYRTKDLLEMLQNEYDYQESDGYGDKESEMHEQLKSLPVLKRNIPLAEKVKLRGSDPGSISKYNFNKIVQYRINV